MGEYTDGEEVAYLISMLPKFWTEQISRQEKIDGERNPVVKVHVQGSIAARAIEHITKKVGKPKLVSLRRNCALIKCKDESRQDAMVEQYHNVKLGGHSIKVYDVVGRWSGEDIHKFMEEKLCEEHRWSSKDKDRGINRDAGGNVNNSNTKRNGNGGTSGGTNSGARVHRISGDMLNFSSLLLAHPKGKGCWACYKLKWGQLYSGGKTMWVSSPVDGRDWKHDRT